VSLKSDKGVLTNGPNWHKQSVPYVESAMRPLHISTTGSSVTLTPSAEVGSSFSKFF